MLANNCEWFMPMPNESSLYNRQRLPDAPDAQWQARREFAAQLRQLCELAVTADVPAAQLSLYSTQLREQAEALSSLPMRRGKMAHINASEDVDGERFRRELDIVNHELSVLTGPVNPLAAPLNLWFEGDKVHGRATMGWRYEGPPGCVHGGFVAALFDHFLGAGQLLASQAGPTGTLKVRYSRPTPIDCELELLGWVESEQGRKNSLRGEMRANGVLTASCEGLFIAISGDQATPKQAPYEHF